MKTVFIYDELVGELKFLVLEGDYSHLNGIYLNSIEDDEDKQAELDSVIYLSSGDFKHEMLTEFPVEAVKEGAKVIVCGRFKPWKRLSIKYYPEG